MARTGDTQTASPRPIPGARRELTFAPLTEWMTSRSVTLAFNHFAVTRFQHNHRRIPGHPSQPLGCASRIRNGNHIRNDRLGNSLLGELVSPNFSASS